MKTVIQCQGDQFILSLEPENDKERAAVTAMSKATLRTHSINCRGYQYMAPAVEFLIQPQGSSD